LAGFRKCKLSEKHFSTKHLLKLEIWQKQDEYTQACVLAAAFLEAHNI